MFVFEMKANPVHTFEYPVLRLVNDNRFPTPTTYWILFAHSELLTNSHPFSQVDYHDGFTSNRDRGTSSSARRARFAILRRDLRQIQTSERNRRRAPDRRHNDTTTAFRGPASGPHRYILFAPFRASPPCRECAPTRWRRIRRAGLLQFQNS